MTYAIYRNSNKEDPISLLAHGDVATASASVCQTIDLAEGERISRVTIKYIDNSHIASLAL